MSLAFSVVWPLMWRAAYIYVVRGKAWKLFGGGTTGKWLSVKERREVIRNWVNSHLFHSNFHGIQIFPKWLPLGPVIPIATFVELVLSGLILFCAGFVYFLGPYFWPIIVLLKWTVSIVLAIAGKLIFYEIYIDSFSIRFPFKINYVFIANTILNLYIKYLF